MDISKLPIGKITMTDTHTLNIKELRDDIETIKSDQDLLSNTIESNSKANEDAHSDLFKTMVNNRQIVNEKLNNMNSQITLLTGNLGETRAKVILLESTLEEVITEMAANIKVNQIIIATLVVIIIIQLIVIFKMVYR